MDTVESKENHHLSNQVSLSQILPSTKLYSSHHNMQAHEVVENHNSLLSLQNHTQNQENSLSFYPTRIFSMSHVHDFSSSLNNDAVFDEGTGAEGEQGLSYEKRIKRMISNRESARRSRMRKKKQIEELQYQVDQLHVTNRQLSEKLIQLLEGNQHVLQENAQLKERVSSLQVLLSDLISPLQRNVEMPPPPTPKSS